jgi:DNA damage-binding protein 1
LSFVGETKVLGFDEDEDIAELDSLAIIRDESTIFCTNTVFDQSIQITPNRIILLNSNNENQCAEWVAGDNQKITLASANLSQIVIALGGDILVYFEIGQGTLEERRFFVQQRL